LTPLAYGFEKIWSSTGYYEIKKRRRYDKRRLYYFKNISLETEGFS